MGRNFCLVFKKGNIFVNISIIKSPKSNGELGKYFIKIHEEVEIISEDIERYSKESFTSLERYKFASE